MQPINYRNRLEKVADRLGSEALLVLAQPEAVRNSDVGHSYRQESFLYYLTGLDEPNSALLVVPREKDGVRFIAFVAPSDPVKELWEGRMIGVDGAKTKLAVDEAFPIAELWTQLVQYLKGHTAINYCLGRNADADRSLVDALTKVKRARPRYFDYKMPIVDSDKISGEMRQIKDSCEIERMKHAANITRLAFDKVFQNLKPGMNEREVHGMLTGEYFRLGAEMEAYGSIVAGGDNACILHYVKNDQTLRDNDLILIDSGAQFEYYASDVTRTFPVGNKFSNEQRALYEIVLKANEEAIEMVKPGVTLPDIHSRAVEVLVEGLLRLNLLQGLKNEIIESGAYKKFYPHNTSHWLGMDVHDVGAYMVESNGDWQPKKLQAGMVLTVEPGLYIPTNDTSVPESFRGIGIRIEDDIVVTADGYLNLTQGIKKDIASLENRNSY